MWDDWNWSKKHASLDVSDVLLKWFKLLEYEFHYRKQQQKQEQKQNENFFVQPQNRQTFTFSTLSDSF